MIDHPLIETAASLLVHQLWQGMALFGLAALCVRRFPRLNAATRYWVWTATAIAIALLPLAYFSPKVDLAERVERALSAPGWGQPATAIPIAANLRPMTAADAPEPVAAASTQAVEANEPSVWAGLAVWRDWLFQRWAGFALLAWLAVAAWKSARIVRGALHVRRVKRSARTLPAGHPLQAWFAKRARRAGVARAVRLGVSPAVECPAALGFRHPMIVLPERLLREFSEQEIRQMMMHELAHVKRRDDWVNVFQKFTEALFFHHPGLRGASRRMDLTRESACDAWAVAETGNPKGYANCLVKVFETMGGNPGRTLAVSAVGSDAQLSHRVGDLLEPGRRGAKPAFGLVALFMGVLSLAFVSLASATPRPAVDPPAAAAAASWQEDEEDHLDKTRSLVEAVEAGEMDVDTALEHLEAARIAVIETLGDGKQGLLARIEEAERAFEGADVDTAAAMEAASRALAAIDEDLMVRQMETGLAALESIDREEMARLMDLGANALVGQNFSEDIVKSALEAAEHAVTVVAIDPESLTGSMEAAYAGLADLDEDFVEKSLAYAAEALEGLGHDNPEIAKKVAEAKRALQEHNITKETLMRQLEEAKAAAGEVKIDKQALLRELEVAKKALAEQRALNKDEMLRELARAKEAMAQAFDQEALMRDVEKIKRELAERLADKESMMRELERAREELAKKPIDREMIQRELERAKLALEETALRKEDILRELEVERKKLEELRRQKRREEKRERENRNP